MTDLHELTIAKLIETLMDNYDLSERVVEYSVVMNGESILSMPVELRPTNVAARQTNDLLARRAKRGEV